MLFAAFFLAALAAAVFAGLLSSAILILYVLASAAAFVAYAMDKSAARRGQWRITERSLHAFSLAGGWPGALVAQKALRHKTQKQAFQFVFWTTVVLNCAILLAYVYAR